MGATTLTLVLLLGYGFQERDHALLILFLIPIIVSAYAGGLGPGMLATGMAALESDYYLLPPLHSFSSYNINGPGWVALLFVGTLIAVLVHFVRTKQQRLEAIVSSSEDAIISKTLNGIITSWNPGAERIFGYSATEALGRPMLMLFPPERFSEETAILTRIAQGAHVGHFDTVRVRKDGRRIDVSVCLSPITDGAGKIIGASKIARDITQRVAHERELVRLTRLYDALSQINQAIVWEKSRGALFNRICRVVVERCGFGLAWIGWHDPATRLLVPAAVAGDETNYIQSIAVYADDRPEGRGPAGTAFRQARPCICNNMLNDPGTLPWREELTQRGFQAAASFPIRLQGEVSGIFTVYAVDPEFFLDKEIALLEEAAGDISFALDNFAREELRQAAEARAQAEKLFSDTMINSMPGIVYLYNQQGQFLRWNQNFEIVSGYTGQEIAGRHPQDFFSADDSQLLFEKIAEVFTRGESSVEASFVAKDGTATPHFFTGRRVIFGGMTCLVGVGIDISDQKRAQAELRKSEQRYRTTLDNLMEGGQLIGFDWRYLYLNKTAASHNRRPNEELQGRIMTEMWPGIEGTPMFAMLRRCMEGRIALHEEVEFAFPDGTNGWYDVRCQPVSEGLFALSIDITERKEAEKALHELNLSLEHKVSERTAELQATLVRAEAADRIKSAFLATMSHELRTPLNSIIGFTGIVLQGLAGPLNAEQTKQLGMVQGSARHLLELINDVLDISKIEAGQLEIHPAPFDLAASLERVTGMIRPLASQKGLTLTLTGFSEPLSFVSDRRRVEQILLNLLNNAVKFTNQGGVTLTTALVPGYHPAPGGAPGPAVRIDVSDTGIGIKPEDLATLFQPFRQIDTGLTRQHEGTGLGLAICRRLAALLHGEITATSQYSRGSVFTVILPVLEQSLP